MINWKELVEKSGVAIAIAEAAKNQIINSIDHALQKELEDTRRLLEAKDRELHEMQAEVKRLNALLELEMSSHRKDEK